MCLLAGELVIEIDLDDSFDSDVESGGEIDVESDTIPDHHDELVELDTSVVDHEPDTADMSPGATSPDRGQSGLPGRKGPPIPDRDQIGLAGRVGHLHV